MTQRSAFRFLGWTDRKYARGFRYEASFWEGPCESGQQGRWVRREIDDVMIDACKPLNTAPSVSYFGALLKAVR